MRAIRTSVLACSHSLEISSSSALTKVVADVSAPLEIVTVTLPIMDMSQLGRGPVFVTNPAHSINTFCISYTWEIPL